METGYTIGGTLGLVLTGCIFDITGNYQPGFLVAAGYLPSSAQPLVAQPCYGYLISRA